MESRMVGKSIRVLMGGAWMEGFISEYHPDRGYQVQFFDGDSDWLPSLDKNVEVLNDEEEERPLGHRVPSAEEIEDINFFDENEEELAIIPSNQFVKNHSNRELESQSEERRKKHADEKGSRRSSRAPSEHSSHHSPRVADTYEITANDELLMQEIDDSIMGRDAPDGNQSPRVVVNTYDPAVNSEDEMPRILPRQNSNRSSFDQKDRKLHDSQPMEDVLLDMENGEFDNFPLEHLPHPMEYYQEKSHELIVAQSVLLQPLSVLLVGSVLSVTFTPSSNNNREAKEHYAESKDSRHNTEDFFFRVLFIEGGSQPIMFRCKTPIFTSNTTLVKVSSSEYSSIFRENLFRCDMLMPEANSNDVKMKTLPASHRSTDAYNSNRKGRTMSTIPDAKESVNLEPEEEGDSDPSHTAPFAVTGEIVISVYKVRSNGGNDLMGQMIVDLDKMSKYGTYEYFNEICEGRCYSGKYPLTLPNSNGTNAVNAKPLVVGEIELHLALAWKIASNDVNATTPAAATGSRPPIRPKSASATGPSSKKVTATATTGGTATASKKKVTTAAEPRKTLSAYQRKQREDQRRIDLENKKLQQYLQKASGKAGTGTAYTKTKAPNPLKPNPQVNNFLVSPSPSLVADAKDNASRNKNPEQAVYEKYLHVYNQLKKSIAEEDDAMTTLKGRYKNVNIQIKKYQTLIEKAKLASQGGGFGGGNQSITTNQSRTATNRLRESKEGSPLAERRYANKTVESSSENRNEETKDPEYQSIKEEYEVMQRIRKSLIDRIVKAKEFHQRYQQDIQSMLSQRHLLQNRIDAIYEKQEQQKQQTYGATTTIVFDESQSQFEKLSQRQSQKPKIAPEDNDVDTFLTLTALLQEKQYYLEQIDENVDYYALQSNYEELNRSYLVLQEKLNQINKEIEELQRQKEEMLPLMSRSVSKEGLQLRRNESKESEGNGGIIEREITERRELIYFLQKLLLEADVEFRQSQIFSQMKENDIQLMYLQMKQKEREEVTLSAISSIPNFSSIALSNQNSSEALIQGLSYSRSNNNSQARL